MPRTAALVCAAALLAAACWFAVRPDMARSKSLCTAGMAFVPGGTHVYGSSPMLLKHILTQCNRSLGSCYQEWFDGELQGYRKITTGPVCVDRFEYPNEPGVMPQISTDWVQAQRMCEARGKRLCTDVEWELACAGDAGSQWPYGNKHTQGLCNFNSKDLEPSGSRDTCVSQYGAYDMSGNASEWTLSSLAQITLPPGETLTPRVVKGGNFRDNPLFTRCAFREAYETDVSYDYFGFRCCSAVN